MPHETDTNNPIETLSDEDLKDLIARKREIESMSREDMIAELMKAGLTPSSQAPSFEVHPESRLAALGKSPDEMFMADLKSNPAWFNVLWCFIFFGILMIMISVA